jgi:hypothetical protein
MIVKVVFKLRCNEKKQACKAVVTLYILITAAWLLSQVQEGEFIKKVLLLRIWTTRQKTVIGELADFCAPKSNIQKNQFQPVRKEKLSGGCKNEK